jgi:hypothetical protein
MNFFEKELRKLFASSPVLEDIRFAGRICVGRLSDAVSVKLEFTDLGRTDHYGGIRATVMNRREGQIDVTLFRFEDILGKKAVPAPYYKDGVIPHIWKYNDQYGWYAYQPTLRDYEQISDTVSDYLEMFQEPVQTQRMTQEMK